jgi:PadR family transcriptional regulator, regulatory protein AphA
MSLEYAILGFIQHKPLSGYDLKKVFDTSVSHFWPADQSQIYRTLNKLTEAGWAEMEVIEQSDRPDRKIYHITLAGRAELYRWLSGPFPSELSRSAPLVQVFFSGQLSDEQILEKFENAVADFKEVISRYQQVPGQIDELVKMVNSPREIFFGLLTLELGIKTAQAQLEWAESIIQRIKNHDLQLVIGSDTTTD